MKKIFLIFVFTFVSTNLHAEGGGTLNAAGNAAKGVFYLNAVKNSDQGKNFMKKCTGTPVYCGMAVLAFAQALSDLQGGKGAKKTADASACSGGYCGVDLDGTSNPSLDGDYNWGGSNDPELVDGSTGGGGNNNPNSPSLGGLENDIKTNLGNLGSKGYTYDPKTNSVKTPNGSIAASTFGSADGLRSLGLSDSEIGSLQKAAADALKQKYSADAVDYDGGGGGLNAKGAGANEKGFDMNKYLASLMEKKHANRGVAGLEKKYGSDQIGIAQDDIFKMIHRRYEAKKSTLNP